MNFTELSIRRPVLAWMLMAATVLFGLVAFQRIGISQFPDVDFPTITVNVTWEGAAPEILETDVVEPIEEAVVQVEGIRSITSTSQQGAASVTIELELERDVDAALQDVQTRIAQAQRQLPRDLDPPVVSKTNPEDNPIMWVGLSGPYPRAVLADYARYRLKETLQTVSGVGEITLGGYLDRNVRIWLNAAWLDQRRVTVGDVIGALQRQHVELPGGFLQTGSREISVRVLGEAFDLDELRKLVVREVDGAPVYLSDVALVEDGFEDVRRLGRAGGQPAQGLGIRKLRGANAVEVGRAVKAELESLRAQLPKDMQLGLMFDSTRFIEESVHEVEFELLLAVLLTALVCWMFLGSLSSTLNVVLAIPMSLFGTLAVIYFLGFTLNTFTLLGLSLAVGIVVDDAIMVMENIFRHAELGKERVRAAREGTAEITFAALAATAAVIAIFIPVVFMKGVVGKFFLQFGVTLCLAVMFSYLEAITLAPSRSAQLLNTSRHDRGRLGRAIDAAFRRLEQGYEKVLARGLKVPGRVLVAGLVLTVGAVVVLRSLPSEFVPSQDQSRLMLRFQTAVGSSLEETDELLKHAEAFVNARPEVELAYLVVGGFGGGSVSGGVMFVTLKPPSQRKLSQLEFAGVLRKELNAFPGLKTVVQDLSQQGFTAQRGFPVEFSVRGSDWDELVKQADLVRQKLLATGTVVDLDTDYRLGQPELRITPDRQRTADVGVSMEDVGSTINALVGGLRVGKFNSNGRRIDMRVRLLADQRTSPEDIARLRVRTPGGELLPLSALVTQVERPVLQAITRRDRERAISFFANPAPGHSQADALQAVEQISRELEPGYRAVLGGASVAFRESFSSLVFALALGILVAYMVLASQFNSFLHPVTVLTILPLSIAGAAFALLAFGATLNIFSMIGLLLLMGIVKKNSIILVDYATQQRALGLSALEAMQKAGPVRLRPILMTSIATMMAAVPSALALGPGSEVRRPMAIAVIGGLIVSTALSLLVVPAFYLLADRAKQALAGRQKPAAEPQPTDSAGT
ncbi:MAG: efflux RND transporter permease subunit [Myxococcales bacterium]|nr:efflux RND transporter permease subunit [Myxococcales bacterium]